MLPLDTIQTPRLIGERMRPDHLDGLYRLHRDPRVMATLSADGQPLPDEQTREGLRRNLDHWDRQGFGLWVWRDRADGRFVGRGGLKHVEVGGNEEIEVGYALLADEWGKGFATEIARAAVAAGFERLGLPDLVCFTLTDNRASRRVMEKAGFRYERDIVHAGLPHVFYRLTADGWRGDRAAGSHG